MSATKPALACSVHRRGALRSRICILFCGLGRWGRMDSFPAGYIWLVKTPCLPGFPLPGPNMACLPCRSRNLEQANQGDPLIITYCCTCTSACPYCLFSAFLLATGVFSGLKKCCLFFLGGGVPCVKGGYGAEGDFFGLKYRPHGIYG